jgi:hypothetical protein
MDVRKSFVDAGYITVGLGVMGFQQAQVRRRRLQQRAQDAGTCITGRARSLHDQVNAQGRALDVKAREAKGRAEGTVNETVSRVTGLATEVSARVEPVFVHVQATAAELPERLAQAIEPVATRVRERLNRAA